MHLVVHLNLAIDRFKCASASACILWLRFMLYFNFYSTQWTA